MRKISGEVSIVLIIFVLLTLILGGTTYWMYTESERFRAELLIAKKDIADLEQQIQDKQMAIDAVKKELTDWKKECEDWKSKSMSNQRQRDTWIANTEKFKKESEANVKRHRVEIESKKKYIEELRTERKKLNNDITQTEAKLSSVTDTLSKKIEKLERDKQDILQAKRGEVTTLQTRVRQLEDRIAKLIDKRVEQFQSVEKDGEILQANNEQRLVAINLGKRENIQLGMKFEVFQIRGGGKYVPKGVIEIKEVRPTVSLGYIETLHNINDPLMIGDNFGSPLYDRNAKKRFYVAGDFKKYQKGDLEKLIKESGALVVDKIGIYTDFVVLGHKNIGTAKQEAIDMGVVLMNETDLLKYIMD